MLLDPKDMIEAIAEVVGEQVRAATAPLAARIVALEARQPAKGDPGKDADPALVKQLVEEAVSALPAVDAPAPIEPDMAAIGDLVERAVAAKLAELPAPKDGTSVTLDDVRPVIEAAAAALPKPADGKDADPALVRQMVDEEVRSAVAAIELPEAPAPLAPDMAAIGELIAGEVAMAVAALPVPEDGRSVTLDEVRPLVDEAVTRAVAAIPVPRDGIGAAGAVIDRDGHLVLTLTDGSVRALGQVVGRDADMAAIEKMLRELVDAIPRPENGADGLGFDDLSVVQDGPRAFHLRFARGDTVKTFPFTLPVVLDAGVWKEGTTYVAGDGCTWAGSYWIAQQETNERPDSGPRSKTGWRLAVKKGRDAKLPDPVTLEPAPNPES
jgi:hypothetical protein